MNKSKNKTHQILHSNQTNKQKKREIPLNKITKQENHLAVAVIVVTSLLFLSLFVLFSHHMYLCNPPHLQSFFAKTKKQYNVI